MQRSCFPLINGGMKEPVLVLRNLWRGWRLRSGAIALGTGARVAWTPAIFFGFVSSMRKECNMVKGVGIRLRSFERVATAIVVLIALPTCLVFSQISTATATILGVVKDSTGALIPGVS